MLPKKDEKRPNRELLLLVLFRQHHAPPSRFILKLKFYFPPKVARAIEVIPRLMVVHLLVRYHFFKKGLPLKCFTILCSITNFFQLLFTLYII